MDMRTSGGPLLDIERDVWRVHQDVDRPESYPGWILSSADRRSFECRAYLAAETDGEFSIWSANLPGVASQGATEAEAIANFSEAFSGAYSIYAERGEVPWTDVPQERPADAKELWILVHA